MNRLSGLLACVGLLVAPICAHAQQQTAAPPPASAQQTQANGQPPAQQAQQDQQAGQPAQQVGQVPAPGTPIPPSRLLGLPSIDDAALQQVQQDMMPLSPGKIRELRRKIDDQERAASEPPKFVPKPVTSSLRAVLSPGATPPVVRLYPGYVTNVLFIDEAGRPMIVRDVDLPDKKSFTVTWNNDPKTGGTNSLTLSPNETYATGNIAAHLEGLNTPVTLMVVSGQREIDIRADVRVAGVGSPLRSDTLPAAADAGLQAFLDGIPPKSAVALKSSQAAAQVWSVDGHFVVRAPEGLSLISPAFLDSKSSADGTTIYVIPQVSPIVALVNGSPVNINVTGY